MRSVLILTVGLLVASSIATAQDGRRGRSPEDRERSAKSADESRTDESRTPPQEGEDEKEESKKPDEGEESEDSGTENVIRRGDRQIAGEAKPVESEASVGDDGRVTFQFRNQPWVELIEWLSDISDLPLDWQELPGDRVNLTSPGRYTVEQTRDLFNRHLLARGYTLLELDGGLTVAKTEGINPALVPRVEPSRLGSMPPYSFVRTSLDVGWLSSEKLAEELQPMISSNGQLTALSTTNRIEAMDAAVNLRQVAELLAEEHDTDSRTALAPEFELRHIPAEEAKELLEQFLGVEEKESGPLTPQQIQAMQRARQQNKDDKQPQKEEPEIAIVANTRRNSVLIRAPVDRVAIAREFIKRIDVPSGSLASLSDVQSRVQVFRLESLDPEKLIEIVQEMNVLEPSTRIRVDQDNQAVIVSGSAADRFIIDSLIERLDGSGRRFEVLQLRRLDANAVAESIAFLMGQEQEEESGSRRSYYYYSRYDDDQNSGGSEDEFRVTANARYRQVLLWANEREMEEVRSLLVKLGELPPPGGRRETMRVIEASATPETYQYLQRLSEQWQRVSPHPLELPEADAFDEPDRPERSGEASADAETPRLDGGPADAEQPEGSGDAGGDDAQANEPDEATEGNANEDDANEDEADKDEADESGDSLAARTSAAAYRLTAAQPPGSGDSNSVPPGSEIRSAEDFDRYFGGRRSGGDDAPADEASESTERDQQPAAPVQIAVDSRGNLVLSSSDTAALDQLERLMQQVAPPQRPYKVFHLEHAAAYWVQLNLEDYFAQEDSDEDSGGDSFYSWYYGSRDDDEDEGPTGLGRGNELRFISDEDTNTLVVSGASAEQLHTISELIELWDVPASVDQKQMRYTRLVPIRYSKAEVIAETVKEAYRDLLSSNDKAFGGRGGGNARGNRAQQTQRNREGDGSGLTDTESGQNGGGPDFSFQGKLSLGVDEIGNTLLVSAQGEPLLELVCDMIDQLDQAAQPRGDVQVVQLPGTMSDQSLRRALEAFGLAPTAAAPTDDAAEPRRPAERQWRRGRDRDGAPARTEGTASGNFGREGG